MCWFWNTTYRLNSKNILCVYTFCDVIRNILIAIRNVPFVILMIPFEIQNVNVKYIQIILFVKPCCNDVSSLKNTRAFSSFPLPCPELQAYLHISISNKPSIFCTHSYVFLPLVCHLGHVRILGQYSTHSRRCAYPLSLGLSWLFVEVCR